MRRDSIFESGESSSSSNDGGLVLRIDGDGVDVSSEIDDETSRGAAILQG